MSEREQVMQIIDALPDFKIKQILVFLRGVQFDDEIEDDAFCEQLYQRYLDDPEKDESFSLDDCKREWGLA